VPLIDIRLFQGIDVSLGRRRAVGNSHSAVGCRSYKSIPTARVDTPLDIRAHRAGSFQRYVDPRGLAGGGNPSFQQG
jgi:hypothetical protein